MSSTPKPPATATAPAPATTPKAPKAEDDQHEEGSSIDTFCEYQPTALPDIVVEACNRAGGCCTNNNNKENIVVIHDNDDETTQHADEPSKTKTLTLTIPAHPSSACESALLASVPAPLVRDPSTAACLLPLLTPTTSSNTPVPLSPLQLEGVLLCLQRHRRILPGGERAGFFLGDGAGIGKGRQIAAILRDSLCRRRTRHVWLSVSRELLQDARRDLRDVGVHCNVHDGTSLLDASSSTSSGSDKGILFLTYSLLVSGKRLEQIVSWCAGTQLLTKSTSKHARAKLRQLEQSFSGCIVFDEAHKAKNLANDTKTAKLVLQLQRRLPKARVVYCSATGVSDVAHLAYAERLGLWDNSSNSSNSCSDDGGGNPTASSAHNFANFAAFQKSLEQRGLGSLELLALELKQQGSFLARTLSWEGAEFQTTQVALTKDRQQVVYDQSVLWWTRCKADMETAVTLTESDSKPNLVFRLFWSAQQRFFKELAICAKVPFLAQDALQQVNENGCCVVLGLQSTGEAGMQSLLEKYGTKGATTSFQDEHFPSLLSTVAAVLTNFVQNHFPVTPSPPETPKLASEQPPPPSASMEERHAYASVQAEISRIAALPPPEPIPELVQMRQTLLKAIPKLNLPPNPLDDLIDRLGGVEHVAEMTGRSGRMIRACSKKDPTQKKDYFVYSKRVAASNNNNAAASQDDSDRVNLVERRQFMDGKKSYCIISDAASTGISLHAARGSAGSRKRRVHYTIELPWSADKAVQQLGRSHRSGQHSAPIYKLVVTTLGGERRFAAAVSKRMASLGALTKGDRRAATGADMLSEFDLDSKYGKRALKRAYAALEHNERRQSDPEAQQNSLSVLPSRNAREILDQFVNQMIEDKDAMVASLPSDAAMKHAVVLSVALNELDIVGLDADNRKKADVRVFLNRIAGLAVTKQKLVFSLFMSTLEDVIKDAKATGEWEGNAEDIKATSIEIGTEQNLAVDPASGAQTKLSTLVIDRGISLDMACNMAVEEAWKEPTTDAAMAKEEQTEDDQAQEEIINVDEDDDDEWMSKAKSKDVLASSGFYISRNRITGRHLVLFAKCKFHRAAFKTEEEAANFDPLGLMVITRPNTGTNLTDMPTRDIKKKYRLAFSCQRLKECVDVSKTHAGDTNEEAASSHFELVKQANSEVANLWMDAYEESNRYNHQNGLAPRRAEVALVTGPVLHVLPALEKAVKMRSEKDRALKIMRAQVEARRVVGVRFPNDADAIEKLQAELEKLLNARNDAGKAFTDEALSPICPKSLEWATSERKTMKSFFKVATPGTNGKGKSVKPVPPNNSAGGKSKFAPVKRRSSASASSASSSKKTKTSITSFFAPNKNK